MCMATPLELLALRVQHWSDRCPPPPGGSGVEACIDHAQWCIKNWKGVARVHQEAEAAVAAGTLRADQAAVVRSLQLLAWHCVARATAAVQREVYLEQGEVNRVIADYQARFGSAADGDEQDPGEF